MTTELPFTGERFIPGTPGEIWVEHWHRYHFASRWAAGRRVLDVACGEGYGSALLARHAASVVGVDIAQAAVDHARAAYSGVANLEFSCAPCTSLPLGDATIDLAVSFETLEHIEAQERFLDELARVLDPEGVLLLSCPNKLEYSDKRDYHNEFHVRELYRDELAAMVAARFPLSTWFAQRPTFFSVIAPETPAGAHAQLVEVQEAHPAAARETLSSPLYFIVAASRSREALDAVVPALSVLADRDEWVYRDYAKVIRMLEHAAGDRDALKADLAARELALAEGQRELDRRRGWRWWLKLPLVRLGILR
ncbi:MAG TPA: class I SAM-dependent methyltransferase [Usitatibacter sp.]|jgi:ubiquinone/menaquinone biosynthesis C-methylase UbiE|nr:class I SAM-dependent methyltransferase [Usitatibacter sp.]